MISVLISLARLHSSTVFTVSVSTLRLPPVWSLSQSVRPQGLRQSCYFAVVMVTSIHTAYHRIPSCQEFVFSVMFQSRSSIFSYEDKFINQTKSYFLQLKSFSSVVSYIDFNSKINLSIFHILFKLFRKCFKNKFQLEGRATENWLWRHPDHLHPQ